MKVLNSLLVSYVGIFKFKIDIGQFIQFLHVYEKEREIVSGGWVEVEVFDTKSQSTAEILDPLPFSRELYRRRSMKCSRSVLHQFPRFPFHNS